MKPNFPFVQALFKSLIKLAKQHPRPIAFRHHALLWTTFFMKTQSVRCPIKAGLVKFCVGILAPPPFIATPPQNA